MCTVCEDIFIASSRRLRSDNSDRDMLVAEISESVPPRQGEKDLRSFARASALGLEPKTERRYGTLHTPPSDVRGALAPSRQYLDCERAVPLSEGVI